MGCPPRMPTPSITLWGEGMGLNIGASPADNVMLASQQVDKVMLGASLVWEAIKGDRLMGWRKAASASVEIAEINPDTGAVITVIGTIPSIVPDTGTDFGGTRKRAFCTLKRSGDSGYGVGEMSLKNAAVLRFVPDVYTTNTGAGIGGNADILMTSRWSQPLTERNPDTLAVTRTGSGQAYVERFDGVGETPGALAVSSDEESGYGGYKKISFSGLSAAGGSSGSSMRDMTSFGGTASRYFDRNRRTVSGEVKYTIEELQVPPDNRTVIDTVDFTGNAYHLFGVK